MNTIKHIRITGILIIILSLFIYVGGVLPTRLEVVAMNFFKKKNQRKIAAAICILVIIAMVVPMVLGSVF